MKRLAAALAVAGALIAPAVASAHTVSADKPVVFISGAEAGPVDCKQHFAKLRKRLRDVTVDIAGKPTRFTGDFEFLADEPDATNCAYTLPSVQGSVRSRAGGLANWLWQEHSSKGQVVDIVAEGTAGAVVRTALALKLAPGPLKVEDVVTIGTPHAGAAGFAGKCERRDYCADLDTSDPAGVTFLKELATYPHPQGANGTDWTVIGSTRDELVTPDSALAMDADHKALYEKPLLKHAELIDDDATGQDATISYSHRGNYPGRTMKGRHVVDRVGDDLVYGPEPVTSDDCAGYNDQPNGPVIVDANLAAWEGAPVHSYIRSGTLEAYSACFKKVGADRYESTTTVRLNGLDIAPEDDSKIFIDVKRRRITAEKMSMFVPTDWFDKEPILLREDAGLDWSLPKSVGAPLSNDDVDGIAIPEKFKIAGFPINQTLKVSMQQGGVSLELELKLPEVLNRFAPEKKKLGAGLVVSVRTDNAHALSLDKLGGSVEGDLKLGSIVIEGGASFSYSLVDNEWTVSANARVPLPRNPKLGAGLTVKDWQVKAVSGEIDDLQQPLGSSGLFLQRIKLGLVLQPDWQLEIGTTLSVLPRVENKSLAEWEGTLEISDTSTKLSGKLKFLDDEVGSGSLEVKYAGSATLQGTLKFIKEYPSKSGDSKIKFDADATISGTADGTGLDISGRGKLCFEASIKFGDDDSIGTGNRCLGQATVRASVKHRLIAFTACGQLDIGYVVSGGVGIAWRAPADGPSGWTADAFRGCDVDAWHTPPADAAQAGRAPGVTLGPSLRGAVIGVQGDGAPPRVALTGPDGKTLAAPAAADGIVRGAGYAFVHVPADNTTYVFVAHPQGGRWTVQAQPGSTTVTGVRYADILPQPEVHASVAGRGRMRTLTYDVKPVPGQVVTFREVGGGVAHTLGTARRSHGTLRFRPAFGPRAVRRIVADVEQRGLPRAEPEVARYVSPKPAVPRAPRGIALRRRGERLAIGWSPVAGASGYAVEVRTGDGRELGYKIEPGAPRRVTVRHIYDHRPSRVTVRALRPDGVAGRAKTVRG